jgi:hypothetical protein
VRSAIVIIALCGLAAAQTGGREVQVPNSPAQVALLATAKQLNEERKELENAFQQARWELDAKNKPLVEKIRKLSLQMDENGRQVQLRMNEQSRSLNQKMMVTGSQIPILSAQVREYSKLPDGVEFDVESMKWVVRKK